jgi:hypothetical protein
MILEKRTAKLEKSPQSRTDILQRRVMSIHRRTSVLEREITLMKSLYVSFSSLEYRANSLERRVSSLERRVRALKSLDLIYAALHRLTWKDQTRKMDKSHIRWLYPKYKAGVALHS